MHIHAKRTDREAGAGSRGEELTGQTLAGYEIREEIGRGGMAAVYKAWQPSLDRPVALKVLHAVFTHDDVFLTRFHHEALLAAQLAHPNIVKIFDAGEHAGRFFIAMEYMPAGSLKTWLEPETPHPIDLDTCVNLIDQVGSALNYAHECSVIHRDIKPSNVLLGDDGRLFLSDFGIAKAGNSAGLTQWGTMIGTVEYMSPEQAQGLTLDHRSDLYSLGVVLYELLTGLVPFSGTNSYSILLAHLNRTPLPPSQLNPDLPPRIDQVVLQALAKDKSRRFQRAGELVEALREAAKGAGSVQVGLRPETIALRRSVTHQNGAQAEQRARQVAETQLIGTVVDRDDDQDDVQAERLYGEAMAALISGRWTDALNLLQMVHSLNPDYIDHVRIGELARRQLATVQAAAGQHPTTQPRRPASPRRDKTRDKHLYLAIVCLMIICLILGFAVGVMYTELGSQFLKEIPSLISSL